MDAIRLEVRQATRVDKKALMGLCRRSVRNDYVPMFMDEFLEDGGLFIALDGVKAVGMVKYSRCLGGDGWLGAARTDPRYRRHGVATAIVEACFEHAVEAKARYVRLWSNKDNKPAQAAVRSMGFHKIAMFKRVMRRIRKPTADLALLPVKRPQTVLPLIRKSAVLKESKSYAGLVNEFFKVDDRVVSDAAKYGNLYRHGDDVCLVEAEPWYGKWRVLEFFPIAGDVRRILDEVNAFARSVPRRSIHTYVPVGSKMARTVHSAGFEVVNWGKDAVLFEKRVRG